MSILVFQHDPGEDAAVLGSILQSYGHELEILHLDEGDPVPADLDGVDGIVSLGGPMNIQDVTACPWLADQMHCLKQASELGRPVVGICLGAQVLCAALGGQVGPAEASELGWHPVTLSFPGTIDPVYAGIRTTSIQFHLHGQEVKQLPDGATPLAGSQRCRVQAFKVGMNAYGFQYHFEWTMEDLARAACDPMVESAGLSCDQVLADSDRHYAGYRRLGDRLCHSLAMLVFPI